MRMERGILEERCRSGLLWEKLEGILFLFAGIMRKRKGGRRLLDGAQADVATVGRKDGTRRRARRLAAGAVGDAPGDFFFFSLRKECAQRSNKRFSKQSGRLFIVAASGVIYAPLIVIVGEEVRRKNQRCRCVWGG